MQNVLMSLWISNYDESEKTIKSGQEIMVKY